MFNGQRLGRLLLSAREKMSASQASLAARANISQPSLSYYETGQAASLPEPEVAEKLTLAYGVSLGDMMLAGGYSAETTEELLDRLPLAEILRKKYHIVDVASLVSIMESAIRDIQATEQAAKERGSGTNPQIPSDEEDQSQPLRAVS